MHPFMGVPGITYVNTKFERILYHSANENGTVLNFLSLIHK